MATLSGAAAIAWFRAHSTNVPGMCLNTVWQAFGSHSSIGPHAGQYPDAMSGWNYATRKHPGDKNPPAGVPVYWGVSPTRTDANARAGDVMVSLGGGNVIGTDVLGSGRIGVTTIDRRTAAISRPYLGWTEDFLGYDVVADGVAPAASAATPIIPTLPEASDMKLIRDSKTQTIAAVGPGRYYPFGPVTGTDMNSYQAVAKVFGAYVNLSHEEFLEVVHAACGNIDLAKPFAV